MAESTADSLRLELKKTMTEILDDDGGVTGGESDGALKAIDEAVKLLKRLREVESKRPESDILSAYPPASAPKVPKEFKCPLSYAIMSEPVVTTSGQTYEKRYILKWLMNHHTCPKTNEVISNRWLIHNNVIDGLITEWCRVNNYDRPQPSDDEVQIVLFVEDIDALLHKISSLSPFVDQTKYANDLSRATKRFANVRAFFVAEIPDSITRLLRPLSSLGDAVDSKPGLQKNIITALRHISSLEQNKTVIAQNPLVIPLLTLSLKQGTAKTRRNSAETLLSLSVVDSNKIIIGNSETLKALIEIIRQDDYSAALAAAIAICFLCTLKDNRERAISLGFIQVLTDKIKAGSDVDLCLSALSSMTTYRHSRVIEEMEDLGFIEDLFSVLRNPRCSETGENAVAIVLRMCGLNTGDRNREKTRLKVIDEEENKYGTFSKLAKQGSALAVTKAEAILQWLKRAGTGEEPQRG